MIPATRIEHFDRNLRVELDGLRLKVAELWRAPRLDEKTLSRVYARIVMIVKELAEKAENGAAATSKRRELERFFANGARKRHNVVHGARAL